MSNFLRLLALLKPYWWRFALAVCCMMVVTLCIVAFTSLVEPIFNGAWSNTNFNIASEGMRPRELPKQGKGDALSLIERTFQLDRILPDEYRKVYILAPALVIIIFVIKGIFSFLGNFMMAFVGQGIVRDIRNNLFNSIAVKPISFFRRRSTGGLISRITSDVDKIQYAVSSNLADLIREVLTIIGLAALVFYLNWVLAGIALLAAPIVLLPIVQFGKRLRSKSKMGQERMEALATRMHETFSGIRIVKAFNAEAREKERFGAENDRLLWANLKAAMYYALTSPVMEFIGAIAVAVMIYWGYLRIADGTMTVGAFGVILAALYGMYNPIKKLSRVNADLQQAFAAVDRVFEVIDLEEEILERPDAVPMPGFYKSIEYRSIYFSYSKREILFDISVEVPKGSVCAIVGLSGAGKTTMVNLLPRFDDISSGAILVDGVDIRRFTLKSLRGNIGIVTQDTILFNDSVRTNIAYGDSGKIPLETIIEAAEAAYAHDFIVEMTDGYDTIIGEKGVRLSGGEKQRLSIARALLRNPPILILDEATSSLDSESERMVQSALENLMANRTTFVIAHRLSTVRRADMIIVLDGGRVVERGTHAELLELDGLYTKLYRLQFSEDSEAVSAMLAERENRRAQRNGSALEPA